MQMIIVTPSNNLRIRTRVDTITCEMHVCNIGVRRVAYGWVLCAGAYRKEDETNSKELEEHDDSLKGGNEQRQRNSVLQYCSNNVHVHLKCST